MPGCRGISRPQSSEPPSCFPPRRRRRNTWHMADQLHELYERFRAHLYHDARLGLALDISRIPFPRLLRGDGAPHAAGVRGHGRARGGRDRQPRREAHGRPLLAARPRARARRRHARGRSPARSRRSRPSPPRSTPAPHRPERAQASTTCSSSASAARPSARSSSPTRSASPGDRMRPIFFDNTDPDGIDRVFDALGDGLAATLVVVISKSGGTKETRNGMLEARAPSRARSASTSPSTPSPSPATAASSTSYAVENGWLARFPMWDWVGGRTTELSRRRPAARRPAGHRHRRPARRRRARWTRSPAAATPRTTPPRCSRSCGIRPPAARGSKDMVVLPYKDRLLLFSRYLQQLVMESLGKEHDLAGNVVNQGIAVYGNKGSTDQHAYVQQLREGVNNFFVTFIEVLQDRAPERVLVEVEPGVTTGDYLSRLLPRHPRRAHRERPRVDHHHPRRRRRAHRRHAHRPLRARRRLLRLAGQHQRLPPAGRRGRQEGRRAVLDLQGKVLGALRASPGKTCRSLR